MKRYNGKSLRQGVRMEMKAAEGAFWHFF